MEKLIMEHNDDRCSNKCSMYLYDAYIFNSFSKELIMDYKVMITYVGVD